MKPNFHIICSHCNRYVSVLITDYKDEKGTSKIEDMTIKCNKCGKELHLWDNPNIDITTKE